MEMSHFVNIFQTCLMTIRLILIVIHCARLILDSRKEISHDIKDKEYCYNSEKYIISLKMLTLSDTKHKAKTAVKCSILKVVMLLSSRSKDFMT